MLGIVKELAIILRYGIYRAFSRHRRYSDAFIRNGVELLPLSVDKVQTRKLRALVDTMLDSSEVNVWRDGVGSDERVYGAEQIFPEIISCLPIREMRSMGESYLGCRLRYYFVLAARLQHRAGNTGSGGGWHRDSPFTPQFKAITYLSQVDEDNGPFEYINGSHTSFHKLTSKFNPSRMRFSDDDVKDQQGAKRTFVGGEGSIIAADTKGLHRGAPIKKGRRYACTVYFFHTEKAYKNFSSLLQKSNG